MASRIQAYHSSAQRLLGDDNVTDRLGKPDTFDADGYVSDEIRDEEDRRLQPSPSAIENTSLVFPSSISGQKTPLLNDLRNRELLLRRAKANDALAHVRESLSGLSYQYINKVRQSTTTREHLRSFSGVKLLTSDVSYHRQVYNRTRRCILILDKDLKDRFPYLAINECKISTAIADVNARGQSQVRLSWFWGAVDGYEPETAPHVASDNSRLLECEQSFPSTLKFLLFTIWPEEVYRVNWLRARAQKNRWEEELPKTEHEMLWTILYFMNKRDIWYKRLQLLNLQGSDCAGRAAYCEEQIHQWDEFGRVADSQFHQVLRIQEPFWLPLRTI